MNQPIEDEEVGRWSLRGLVNQTPEQLKDWVMMGVGLGMGIAGLDPDMYIVTAGGGFLLVTLNIFYVRPKRKAQDEARALEGIELGRALGPQRPLRAE